MARRWKPFSPAGLSLIALAIWSYFEASVWFIPPDLLVVIYLMVSHVRFKQVVLIATAASLVGGVSYYFFSVQQPEIAREILVNTPFITQEKINEVALLYQQYGAAGAFMQGFTFIPFKIWTNLAIAQNVPITEYFGYVILSRSIRFSIFGGITYWLSRRYRRFVRRYLKHVIIGFSAIFLTLQILLTYG